MKIVDINKGINLKVTVFPDNQPHVVVTGIEKGDKVSVVCSIIRPDILLQLMEVSNALTHLGAHKTELCIPYLMGARYDRLMQDGDSFDLEVIANMINMCKFKNVYLFDVHSEVALDLLTATESVVNIDNSDLVNAYDKPNSVLICPDKGARRKVKQYLKQNKNIVDVVYCEKSRNLLTGAITLTVTEPEKCNGRNCVVIDDLCDGGGTFLAIASQITPLSNTLIVTHGIFSKGVTNLLNSYNQIITSDSYPPYFESPNIKIIKHPFHTL